TGDGLLVRTRQILHAAVTVHHGARRRSPMTHGRVQRPSGQLGGLVSPQGPAEQTARMTVHDRGQVAPRSGHLHIRHIGHPHLVDAVDAQAVNLVAHGGKETIGPGRAPVQFSGACAHAMVAHQAFHATASHTFTLFAQCSVDAWAAVGLLTDPMHLAHAPKQAGILLCPFARRAVAPRVVTAGTDSEQAAQAPHRVASFLLLDEGEAFTLRPAVNASAFFSRLCAILCCWYCCLIRRSCLSSAFTAGSTVTFFAMILPSRASLRQRDNMKGWM